MALRLLTTKAWMGAVQMQWEGSQCVRPSCRVQPAVCNTVCSGGLCPISKHARLALCLSGQGCHSIGRSPPLDFRTVTTAA